jgi:hypothetical protein
MMICTYDPADNKLRLSSDARLGKETYQRLKDAGFKWAPRQEIFVAPMWTPDREDLALELCGEIGDEDTSLVDRAEERAERFEDYSEKRDADAVRARDAVEAITDGIPLGQPVLVGHHSERHARKDKERIENGMRKAVRLWETSEYWRRRAEGALQHARYKELPAVRSRRIKGLEADLRKHTKERDRSAKFITIWEKETPISLERAKAISNHDNCSSRCYPLADYPRLTPEASTYEGAMSLWSALDGIITPEQAREQAIAGHHTAIARHSRWISHLENRLTYERTLLGEAGGIATDRIKPEKGGACKCWVRAGWIEIQRVNKVSVTVLDNWGNGGPDFTRTIPFDKLSAVLSKADWQAQKAGYQQPGRYAREDAPGVPVQSGTPEPNAFDRMRETLRAGVQVVSAPQLFVTPPDLADRVVGLAEVRDGHRLLEPSAGTGALIQALQRADKLPWIQAIEVNVALATHLAAFGTASLAANLARRTPAIASFNAKIQVMCADFLEQNQDTIGLFDRIIMNPPFHNAEDVKHILHAATLLVPGGRLVAICAAGPRQAAAFKERPDCRWIDLPAGSFEASGTSVHAAIVVIDN